MCRGIPDEHLGRLLFGFEHSPDCSDVLHEYEHAHDPRECAPSAEMAFASDWWVVSKARVRELGNVLSEQEPQPGDSSCNSTDCTLTCTECNRVHVITVLSPGSTANITATCECGAELDLNQLTAAWGAQLSP
jgi:hypothetical protein